MVDGTHFVMSGTEKHEPMLSEVLNYFSHEQEKFPFNLLH